MRILLFTLCTLLCFQIQAQDEPAIESDKALDSGVAELVFMIVCSDPSDEILNYTVVELVPVMEGCESLKGNDDLKACFSKTLLEHSKKNFTYPKEAMDAKVSAKIYLQFIIEKDNSISNVTIIRSAQGVYSNGTEEQKAAAKLLDAEAIRVVQELKVLKPATQEGKPVRMSFILPINCKPN